MKKNNKLNETFSKKKSAASKKSARLNQRDNSETGPEQQLIGLFDLIATSVNPNSNETKKTMSNERTDKIGKTSLKNKLDSVQTKIKEHQKNSINNQKQKKELSKDDER
ncbi:hypothetical protein IGL98_000490 [Enterococcus sp. DIV0840]|uniref:hypothetical protein n=1 Tax=Enterococcus TaxID=1350 RepID=UPI001A8F2090|nr:MULTISPECIES: hypothetical protein [Enterococcus]MBO0433533.1 hypothetical protein [Enterococcus sp. DIV0849a]MBO0474618.1 hypothetical protein [Enterococcus ureasiticus]